MKLLWNDALSGDIAQNICNALLSAWTPALLKGQSELKSIWFSVYEDFIDLSINQILEQTKNL